MIRLRVFSVLKDLTGTSELMMDGEGCRSCDSVVRYFEKMHPESAGILSRSAFARNGSFIGRDALLEDGDELAILPPVSGG